MWKRNKTEKRIPISPSLDTELSELLDSEKSGLVSRRVFYLSIQAVINAIIIGAAAKLLEALINLITNLSFYGSLSFHEGSPAHHQLGVLVIFIPVIGGLIVGVMAKLGSAAIRGHGIPEAMEQVLTNESRIKPAITLLKPISAAISIGTGGPFGAEGPIIATGGAFGSLAGQIMRISPNERKIMLTAGATAGMAAIFGTPLAAVLLAIELLLFEFSPRSIIPVALACVTGAAMHLLLFGSAPVFAMPGFGVPDSGALVWYVVMGGLMGAIAAFISKSIYVIEDLFEKLPFHWMWWPAIGAAAVGIVGYFAPYTLGVGYTNISALLEGNLPLRMVLGLCFLKFISWSISLGSGTSGGTLAPLLTIGGAAAMGLGMLIQFFFPESGINLSVCALVGMAACFAGAARALLTAIVFALETTMQPNGLLPLLGACTASYFVSFFMMKGSIMTEKIQRRGVSTPDAYEPDILKSLKAGEVMSPVFLETQLEETAGRMREKLKEYLSGQSMLIVKDSAGRLAGMVELSRLYKAAQEQSLASLLFRHKVYVYPESRISLAAELMARYQIDCLPVVDKQQKDSVLGILTSSLIFSAYGKQRLAAERHQQTISLRHRRNKWIVRGRKWLGKGQQG